MNVPFTAARVRAISADDILAAHFQLAPTPGELEACGVDGVGGWRSTNPHPVLSVMRWTELDGAEAALDAVIAQFSSEGRGFDWMTGPAERDLLPLFEDRGFVQPALAIAAMVRPVALSDMPDDPEGIVTQKIEAQRDDAAAQVMATGFDVPSDVGRLYHNAYVAPSDLQRTDVYTASVAGQSEPCAVAYSSYIGDGSLVLMRVAATLAPYRGRGIYPALIKRRLADAARAGAETAIVHAYSPVSQAALEDLGFVTAGELLLHRWRM